MCDICGDTSEDGHRLMCPVMIRKAALSRISTNKLMRTEVGPLERTGQYVAAINHSYGSDSDMAMHWSAVMGEIAILENKN